LGPGIDNQHLREHAPIFSADGRPLGEVVAVESGHLRVRATGEGEFWLPLHTVQSASDGEVRVGFNADQLESYREPGPPP
jgi:hypothetical protein